MEQALPALEDRNVTVGKDRHLSAGLTLQVLGSSIVERRAAHRITDPGLLKRPSQPQIAHEAPRPLRHPVLRPASPCPYPSILPSIDADSPIYLTTSRPTTEARRVR